MATASGTVAELAARTLTHHGSRIEPNAFAALLASATKFAVLTRGHPPAAGPCWPVSPGRRCRSSNGSGGVRAFAPVPRGNRTVAAWGCAPARVVDSFAESTRSVKASCPAGAWPFPPCHGFRRSAPIANSRRASVDIATSNTPFAIRSRPNHRDSLHRKFPLPCRSGWSLSFVPPSARAGSASKPFSGDPRPSSFAELGSTGEGRLRSVPRVVTCLPAQIRASCPGPRVIGVNMWRGLGGTPAEPCRRAQPLGDFERALRGSQLLVALPTAGGAYVRLLDPLSCPPRRSAGHLIAALKVALPAPEPSCGLAGHRVAKQNGRPGLPSCVRRCRACEARRVSGSALPVRSFRPCFPAWRAGRVLAGVTTARPCQFGIATTKPPAGRNVASVTR